MIFRLGVSSGVVAHPCEMATNLDEVVANIKGFEPVHNNVEGFAKGRLPVMNVRLPFAKERSNFQKKLEKVKEVCFPVMDDGV